LTQNLILFLFFYFCQIIGILLTHSVLANSTTSDVYVNFVFFYTCISLISFLGLYGIQIKIPRIVNKISLIKFKKYLSFFFSNCVINFFLLIIPYYLLIYILKLETIYYILPLSVIQFIFIKIFFPTIIFLKINHLFYLISLSIIRFIFFPIILYLYSQQNYLHLINIYVILIFIDSIIICFVFRTIISFSYFVNFFKLYKLVRLVSFLKFIFPIKNKAHFNSSIIFEISSKLDLIIFFNYFSVTEMAIFSICQNVLDSFSQLISFIRQWYNNIINNINSDFKIFTKKIIQYGFFGSILSYLISLLVFKLYISLFFSEYFYLYDRIYNIYLIMALIFLLKGSIGPVIYFLYYKYNKVVFVQNLFLMLIIQTILLFLFANFLTFEYAILGTLVPWVILVIIFFKNFIFLKKY